MTRLNEWIAVKCTDIFGSMGTTYVFFIYGFLPILFPLYMDKFLYWSNTVQLWSLPLLMVGQNVIGRAAEQRAQETHDAVMEELQELRKVVTYLQNGEWSHGSTNHGRTNKENVG